MRQLKKERPLPYFELRGLSALPPYLEGDFAGFLERRQHIFEVQVDGDLKPAEGKEEQGW